MAHKSARKLTQLRQLDFKPWTATLWLVKRWLDPERSARYSVLRVDTDKRLENKLKKAVADRVQSTAYKLEDYDFLTSDQDDRLFTIDSADTDFAKIQVEVDKGLANSKVKKYDDLLNSWAYVVKLDHDGKAVYGMRKINKFTNAAKVKAVSYFIFEDTRLVDLEDKQVIALDTHIDFFSYDGTTFIVNKREFESALNFREGMEKNRDVILSEFVALNLFTDIEPIRKVVGSNLHLLRKISMIQTGGYYKNKAYMADLIKKNVEKGWNLKIKDGVIVVDESSVDLLLKLLNNERVESQINQEVFDAIVKKKVL